MNAPLQVPRNKRSIDDQATPPLPRPAVCFGWSAALTPTITPTITPRTPWPSLPLPAHIRISLNSNTPPPPQHTHPHTPTLPCPAPLNSTPSPPAAPVPPSLSALSCATLLPNQMRKWLVWWLTDSGLARKDKWPKVLEFNTLTKPTWSAGLMLEKIHLWKNKRCVCVWWGVVGVVWTQRGGLGGGTLLRTTSRNQQTGTDLSHPVKNENPHLQKQSLIKPHEEFHFH